MKVPKKKVDVSSIVIMAVNLTVSILAVALFVYVMLTDASVLSSPFYIMSYMLMLLTIIVNIVYSNYSNSRDILTGLSTENKLILRMLQLIVMKKQSAYTGIFFNIKGMKYINRMVSNTGGDQALREYAKKISKELAKGEIITRVGGDNFVAIISKHRVEEILDKISNVEVEVPNTEGELQKIIVNVRCGVYPMSENDGVGELMNNSSVALNYSKNTRAGDIVWFEEKMLENLYYEKQVLYQFHTALRNHEFLVYYQPKVNLHNNKIIGCEALVRWNRDGQIIAPLNFVPILERNGLIQELDFYVMEQACNDMANWKKQGLTIVPVSSNFSKQHLSNPNFSKEIIEMLDRYDLDTGYFEVELTESSDTEDLGRLKEFLSEMKRMKIRTSIDDFGTGFSSLDLLKDHNVEVVKLERSFTMNMEQNNGDNANAQLIKNIIHMCNDMNKTIICEGIENIEQARILSDMRCYQVQGFLFDKPLPESEFAKRLEFPVYRLEESI